MSSTDDDGTDFSKYITYAAIGIGSYIAYKLLFSGSTIEFEHTYKKISGSEIANYPRNETHYVTKPDEIRPIRLAKKGPGSWKPMTCFQIFQAAVNHGPDKTFISQEVEQKDGEWSWRSFTRKEFFDTSKRAACSFIKLGLKPWESVCIIGFNSPEWFFADVGAIYAGGLAAGIYTTNNPGQCKYIANHCKARIVVCENRKQLDKFLEIRDELKQLSAIVMWSGDIPENANVSGKAPVYSWDEFLALSDENIESLQKEMKSRIKAIKPEQCCTLIYTSGTTGPPKAVMISHDNITWNVRALLNGMKDYNYKSIHNSIVSYLPLSHIAAQIADLHAPLGILAQGGEGEVFFARPTALKGTLVKTLTKARPTLFFGVPRVWEKIEEKMKSVGKSNGALVKMIGNWAKGIGSQVSVNRQLNGSRDVPSGFSLANKLVFSKVKQKLGFDRLVYGITGAAPIKKSTISYFGSIGINLVEVYGMSESTGVQTLGRNYYNIIGSVGPTMEGIETIISHDPKRDKKNEGEICMRGRNVMMGYMYDETKTKQAIDSEGLLHSGDVGKKDEDDLLFITGRIKELIITAGGENVAPVPIEDYIKTECPAISNFISIGDKRKFLSALVTLKCVQNMETLEYSNELTGDALEVDTNCTTVDEAKESKLWFKYINSAIEKYNNDKDACVSNASKIRKFTIIEGDFSVPDGTLTSTLKLKRPVIHDRYFEEIDGMYPKD